ncbi:Guanosine nucleotide diphosphate dissociation inhibitor 2 [Camellia lanceoleosa]|uniref:Guanosine nucleotide diphosphate dissociation inhibitor 2 n=1 Tax=Camellia lanceoleosa TaxID=1840588 RepID=A0ACC0HBC7_9ERIC|nr:Guanosine nucleotide diphosphate dissociation inhibitor 2 [Camellia lanceoleosa]
MATNRRASPSSLLIFLLSLLISAAAALASHRCWPFQCCFSSHHCCFFPIWYLFCCSYTNNVASKGKYIAFVTTEVETDNPEVELKPGIDLLGPIDEILFETYDRFVPTNNHDVDNCFISMLEGLKSK